MSHKAQYGKTVEFLDGVAAETSRKEGSVKFAVKQADYLSFLKNQGVPKDAAKQLADANREYHNANIAFASDIIVKDKKVDRVTINTRTPSGVISIRTTRTNETNNPSTGERMTKFGSVSLKLAAKSGLDRELLKECSEAIEKASK